MPAESSAVGRRRRGLSWSHGRNWRRWITTGERPGSTTSVDRLGASVNRIRLRRSRVQLRYGINPHQHATVEPIETDRWPVRVLNGSPSYINMLDALNGWQLVQEASRTLGRPAAASFKHVSPAGAAVAGRIDEVIADLYGVDGGNVESVTSAYLRARDADPKCSYGDLAAVSGPGRHRACRGPRSRRLRRDHRARLRARRRRSTVAQTGRAVPGDRGGRGLRPAC